ncbi:hypothetical protein CDL15_Pgr006411 [Punica granatum]|uniref:Uncharacterized protein n=1 Tax=Punica granatum TaxID=22663 RepID=A0A218Y218_PUNGR|nr:hypothetical protein CDL15_Pgr006411 [Punica granatum]PKI75394.1 hypothetical protein CRG98_004223 [Punica granatum]
MSKRGTSSSGGGRYQNCHRAQKGDAYYGLWLHPLTEHATKEGQAVSTPFWPIGFLQENPDQSPGYYSLPDNRRRTCGHRVMNDKRRAGSTRKAEESGQKNRQDKEPRKQRSRHCGTIHHRITETPKGAQYGTLKIPLSAKVTNDTSGRISGAYHLSWDASDLSRTPFLTRLPRSAPLTSKRHPKNGPTGIQGPPGSWNKSQTTFRNSTGLLE